jgi:hypothetical protein
MREEAAMLEGQAVGIVGIEADYVRKIDFKAGYPRT